MSQARKITISLPSDLVRSIDLERAETGESRSAFLRRVVESSLRSHDHARRVAAYIRGYKAYPESPTEGLWAEAAALDAFGED